MTRPLAALFQRIRDDPSCLPIQALLEMARQSLAELERTAAQKTGKRTPPRRATFSVPGWRILSRRNASPGW